MSWNSKPEDEEMKNEPVEPGEYEFRVTSVEDSTSKSSGKEMKVISLRVKNINVLEYIVKQDGYPKMKARLLFRSVGLVKHDEECELPWDKLVDCKGTAKFKLEEYNGYQNLKVDTYLIDDTEPPF